MYDEVQILKNLGLEIKDDYLDFYDDDENLHQIKFKDIHEISLQKEYTPISKKLSYWLERSFITIKINEVIQPTNLNKDYNQNYELEIDLKSGELLSRKIINLDNLDITEAQDFIENLNSYINGL